MHCGQPFINDIKAAILSDYSKKSHQMNQFEQHIALTKMLANLDKVVIEVNPVLLG